MTLRMIGSSNRGLMLLVVEVILFGILTKPKSYWPKMWNQVSVYYIIAMNWNCWVQISCVDHLNPGKAYKMKPKELWSTKKEYKDFPLDVFRNHIHQEKRFQREGPYWQLKRNKKGLRRHEAHVKELKRGWLGLHNKDKLLVDMMKDLHIN